MVDHDSIRQWAGVLVVGFVIAACGLAISASALRSAQETPAVEYHKNDLGMEFVPVPAGTFQMGCSEGTKPTECSDDERPRHAVQITKAFEIEKTELTQKQWKTIMGSDPSNFPGDNLPVESVSFTDVQDFLARLNAHNDGYLYRLPTEAEWEYAARAGTTDQYAGAVLAAPPSVGLEGIRETGRALDRFAEADEWAWFNVDQTHAVATKKANAWGIYDMRGNVAEWVQDWYGATYYANSPAADPKGPDSGDGRVVRGGSFHAYGWLTRVSLRTEFPEGYSLYDLGFRVVRVKR